MNRIDLSDIYDSCYSGYDDYAAELTLVRDAASKEWRNNSVKFYKTDSYGWAYEKAAGGWNYGYDTLEEAVTKYTGSLAGESAEGSYIASRWLDKQYDYKLNPRTSTGSIYCKITKRMFKGECNHDKAKRLNEGISAAFSKLAG